MVSEAACAASSFGTAHCKNSRAHVIPINGMSKEEAAEFLRKFKLWHDDKAATLEEVADLVGDRFDWLRSVGAKACNMDAVGEAHCNPHEYCHESRQSWKGKPTKTCQNLAKSDKTFPILELTRFCQILADFCRLPF